MIFIGIAGIFGGEGVSKIASVLIIILGVITLGLGGFSITNPLFAIILLGVTLIIQGVSLYLTE